MQPVLDFFAGYQPAELVALGILVVAFFWPGFGVKWMNVMKNNWGLEGRQANLVIILTLFAVSAVATLVTGGFQGFEVTLSHIVAQATFIYMLSQDAYHRIFGSQPEL